MDGEREVGGGGELEERVMGFLYPIMRLQQRKTNKRKKGRNRREEGD